MIPDHLCWQTAPPLLPVLPASRPRAPALSDLAELYSQVDQEDLLAEEEGGEAAAAEVQEAPGGDHDGHDAGEHMQVLGAHGMCVLMCMSPCPNEVVVPVS